MSIIVGHISVLRRCLQSHGDPWRCSNATGGCGPWAEMFAHLSPTLCFHQNLATHKRLSSFNTFKIISGSLTSLISVPLSSLISCRFWIGINRTSTVCLNKMLQALFGEPKNSFIQSNVRKTVILHTFERFLIICPSLFFSSKVGRHLKIYNRNFAMRAAGLFRSGWVRGGELKSSIFVMRERCSGCQGIN